MPTFNQLVSKAERTATYKSTSPACRRAEHAEEQGDRSEQPPEAWRLHRRSYHHPQEA